MKCWDGVLRKISLIILGLFILVTLTACDENEAPVAEAGNKIEASLGSLVQLNGDKSYDPDGSIKDYQWVLSIVPDGSNARIDSPATVYSTFVPDAAGVYIVELIVFDDEMASGRDHIYIDVKTDQVTGDPRPTMPPRPPSAPPMAPTEPGIPPAPLVGIVSDEILLPSTAPISPDAIIDYAIVQKPEAADPQLISDDRGRVSFVPDMIGNYSILETQTLMGRTITETHYSVFIADKPVSAGGDRTVRVGNKVTLSPAFFTTLPPIDLMLSWEIITSPNLSDATIINSDLHNTYFIPDLEGEYEIYLTVRIGDEIWEDSITIIVNDSIRPMFDHGQVIGNCSNCHNGVEQIGKPASHITSSNLCDACHAVVVWAPTITIDHNQVIGDCVDCHNNRVALGKPVNHIDSGNQCDACHSTFSFIPGITVDHTQLFGACVDCHNNSVAMGKNVSHIISSDRCDACHSITAFIPALVIDHNQLFGNCSSCHNGVVAMGKSIDHIASTDECGACHSTVIFVPLLSIDHNEVLGRCIDCHNGIIAIGKSSAHPESSDICAECHNTNSWINEVNGAPDPVLPPNIAMSIESSAKMYGLAELIVVSAIFTNNGEMDAALHVPSTNGSPISVEVSGKSMGSLTLANPNDPQFDTPVAGIRLIRPGESVIREVIWDQTTPNTGLVTPGLYTIEAYVYVAGEGEFGRTKLSIVSEISIEENTIVTDEEALLTALRAPEVMAWYEGNGKDIMCRVDRQIVLVNDYQVIPIETFAPVPESAIKCHTELARDPDLEWRVYFHSNNDFDRFEYLVLIDAFSGEIKPDPVI